MIIYSEISLTRKVFVYTYCGKFIQIYARKERFCWNIEKFS